MYRFSYLMAFFSVLILFSCNTEELRKKTEQLDAFKARQIRDSILLEKFNSEMEEINLVLDSVSAMDEGLRNSEEISKADALSKLGIIDSLLQDRNTQIDNLSKELKNLQSKFSRSLAVGKISEGRDKLKIKSDYYKELTQKIAILEQEKLDLKSIIEQKDKEISQRDSIINEINKERKKQQIKLEKLQSEIIASAKELADATNATADRYYNLACDLRNISDKTSIIFNKKKKKQLINMSYSYFKRSLELGHTDAQVEIDLMESDKKYKKYLTEAKKE